MDMDHRLHTPYQGRAKPVTDPNCLLTSRLLPPATITFENRTRLSDFDGLSPERFVDSCRVFRSWLDVIRLNHSVLSICLMSHFQECVPKSSQMVISRLFKLNKIQLYPSVTMLGTSKGSGCIILELNLMKRSVYRHPNNLQWTCINFCFRKIVAFKQSCRLVTHFFTATRQVFCCELFISSSRSEWANSGSQFSGNKSAAMRIYIL